MIHFLYERLYIDDIESSLINQGKNLASEYDGGEISESLYEKVEWYNKISNSEVFLVDNPRELSACLPFDINYQSIISEEERASLIKGETISKIGFEDRFNRSIMGVVIPLVDDQRLMGVIYLYLPLASIKEVFNEAIGITIGAGILFILVSLLIGRTIIAKLTKPLRQMERVSYKMSQGDFQEKITIKTNDEVGRLASAFNIMSDAISEEEQRRKDFLANVSHELRTPLSYIKGYSEAMIDGTVNSREDSKKYSTIINNEASRMQKLVNDLLDLAKLEGDSYPMKQEPLVFSQLITETLNTYKPSIEQKNLTFKQSLQEDIIILGDEDRLKQVIHNLVDNAIRYSLDGGMLSIRLTQTDAYCELIIKDNGIGMSPETLARVGERFFRADKARSRKQGGTGLGLSIVKKIIRLHDGTMTFESEEQIGTTVFIQLPILDD